MVRVARTIMLLHVNMARNIMRHQTERLHSGY